MRLKRSDNNFIRSMLEALVRAFVFVWEKMFLIKTKPQISSGRKKCWRYNAIFIPLVIVFLYTPGVSIFQVPYAHADFQVHEGTFTKPTSTTTQTISGLPFQPKAIIFFWTSNTSAGFTTPASGGMGFTDGTNSRVVAVESDDNAATSNATRWPGTSDVIVVLRANATAGSNATTSARASVSSLTSDGFQLNWYVNNNQATIIHYLALGGSDVTNQAVGTFTLDTNTGDQSLSALSFRPSTVVFLSGFTGTANAASAAAQIDIGFVDNAGNQGGHSFCERDNLTTNATKFSQQRTDNVILLQTTSCTQDARASFVGMQDNGFTVNKSDAPTANTNIYYLALGGVSAKVGSFNQSGSSGQTQDISGFSFAPQALMLSSFGRVAGTGIAASSTLSIGAASSTGGTVAWFQARNVDSSDSNNYASTTAGVLVFNGTANPGGSTQPSAYATFNSFLSNGFRLNWQRADGTPYQSIYWALGPAPATITLSGTMYTDEGSTELQTAGKSIKVWVGTSTPGVFATTTLAANGFWQINGVSPTGIDAGTRIFAWIDGDSNTRAVTLTKASTTLSTGQTFPNINLYQNRVIAKYEAASGTTTTNADFAAYDWDDNNSIQYVANGGTLSVNAGQELHVWTGNTFAPGGAVVVSGNAGSGTDGSIHVDTNATFTAGGNVTLAGSFTKGTSATYTPGSYSTIFNATTTGKTITGTWYGSGQELGSTTFNGSGGAWSFSGTQASTTDVTITAGTLTAPSGSLTVAGDFTNNGTFTNNGGTLYFSGSGKTVFGTLTGTSVLGNIAIPSGGALTSPWYNYAWNYRQLITINHAKVATTTTLGYAILATTTQNSLKTVANGGKVQFSDGRDIIFVHSDDSTLLKYHIEKYDGTTGTLAAWVSVKDISSSADKSFYLYYGNASAANQQDSVNTYQPYDYAAWHMDNASSMSNSASTTAGTATASAGISVTTGYIGDALSFNGTSNNMSVASLPTTFMNRDNENAWTMEAWVKPLGSQGVSDESLLRSGGQYGPALIASSTIFDIHNLNNNGVWYEGNYTLSAGAYANWHHLVYTYANNGNNGYLYVDGTQRASFNVANIQGGGDASYFKIGWDGSSGYFSGAIDEVRLFNMVLTAGDITTQYNNTADVSTFLTFGSETSQTSAASYTFSSNASTTDLSIGSGATFTAPPLLSVAGNYTNNGTFNQSDGTVEINGAATYRYVRWNITGIKNSGDTGSCNCTQASEFVLLSASSPISWPGGTTATNPGGSNPGSETPDKAIDGNILSTKWLDSNFVVNGHSILVMDAGSGNTVTFDGYKYATGNDYPGRDPVSWTVEGSSNGTDWTVLDTRTSETITDSRNTYTSAYSFQVLTSPGVSGKTYFSGTNPQTLAGNMTGTSAFPSLVFTGSGGKTFSASASTTNLTIQSDSGTVTAPNSFLTVAGDFTNHGTFAHNNGTMYVGSFTPGDVSNWSTLPLSGGSISAIVYDSTHGRYIAAGSLIVDEGSGVRVWESTDLSNWTMYTVAAPGGATYLNGLLYDSIHDKYVIWGTSNQDAIVWESSNLSSWTAHTVANSSDNEAISSLVYDSAHSKYVAVGTLDHVGSPYNADALVWESSDLSSWTAHTIAANTDSNYANSLIYHSGSGKYLVGGRVYHTSSPYDDDAVVWESSDLSSWTQDTVANSGAADEQVYVLAYDSNNSRYVAMGDVDGVITVWESSNLSSWTAYTVGAGYLRGMTYDSVNGRYLITDWYYESGSYKARVWVSSDLSTWTKYILGSGYANTAMLDPVSGGYLVGGLSWDPLSGIWESGISSSTLQGSLSGTSPLGNLVFVDNATIGSTASTSSLTITGARYLTAPSLLSVAGNYTNNGTFTQSTGTTTFNGTSAQVLSGTMTDSSTFPNLVFAGSGSKTFAANASTSNLIIQNDSGTVAAPSGGLLTILGNYVNAATFAHNNATTSALIGGWRGIVPDSGESGYIQDITYNSTNGLYVATGYIVEPDTGNDVVVWTSTNLYDWTLHTVANSTNNEYVSGVVYDSENGKYVVAGSVYDSNTDEYTAVVWESADFSSWTQHTVSSSNSPNLRGGIIYDSANNRYAVAGYYYDGSSHVTVWESNNLTSWSSHDVSAGATQREPLSLVYDAVNSKYLVAGYLYGTSSNDGYIWESSDLTSWTAHALASGSLDEYVGGISYDATHGKYLAVGHGDQAGSNKLGVWESVDLSSWTFHAVDDLGAQVLSTVEYNATLGAYEVVGESYHSGVGNSVYVWQSPDLVTWEKDLVVANGNSYNALFDSTRNYYIVVGGSEDGATVWTPAVHSFQGTLTGSSALGNLVLGDTAIFSGPASTTNLTMATTSSITLPSLFTVSGNFVNEGGTFTDGTGTTTFNGASAQVISGVLHNTFALPNVSFIGAGAKTFASNASTTNIDISSDSGTVTNSNVVTLNGNFHNSGAPFNNSSGTLYLGGDNNNVSGTLTGSSALGNVTVKGGLPAGGAFSNGFSYCRVMTMTAGGLSGGVATTSTVGFPLVATSTIADLKSVANGGKVETLSGNYPLDVVFASGTDCNSPGSVIPFYFEDYTQTTGAFTAWMKAPDISSTTGKTVLMYYGKAGASDQRNKSGVWNTLNIAGKWDLNEDPSGSAPQMNDATGNGNDGTAQNMISGDQVSGMIGGALGFNGTTGYVSTAVDLGSTPWNHIFTYVIWFKTGVVSGHKLMGVENSQTGTGASSYDKQLTMRTDGKISFGEYNGSVNEAVSTDVLNDSQWHQAVALSTGSTISLYVDGVLQQTLNTTAQSYSPSYLRFGSYKTNGWPSASDGYYSGVLDDARVYNTALAPMDILTIYNNTRSSSTFWNIGDEQMAPAAGFGTGAAYTILNNASTTNLTIGDNASLSLPSLLSVAGNYTNNGTFTQSAGTTTFNGTSQQTLSGTMTGTSAFNNLEITNNSGSDPDSSPSVIFTNAASSTGALVILAPSVKVRFPTGAATSSFNSLNLNGQSSGTRVYLRSSSSGVPFGINVGSTQSVSYVDVKDSYACGGTSINAGDGTNNDAGGNSCWTFVVSLSASSTANQTFTLNQSSTVAATISVIPGSNSVITAANDLRIAIASSTVPIRWDNTVSNASISGTAQSKASSAVTYEGNNSVVVIPITENIDAGESLFISNLKLTTFSSIVPPTVVFSLHTGGVADATPDATDTRTVAVTGAFTDAAHTLGDAANVADIAGSSVSNAVLYRFRLAASGENMTVGPLAMRLSGINNYTTNDFSNLKLYLDYNGNGTVDAGDTQVGGAGGISISGQTGSITFSSAFTATTTRDYLVTGNVNNIGFNKSFNIRLRLNDVTTSGVTSQTGVSLAGSDLPIVTHVKIPRGGGSVGADVSGAGAQTGGGGGGGQTIGNEPGFMAPTGTGSPNNQWSNPTNAYVSDDLYASTSGAPKPQDYSTFNFNIPNTDTIAGIEVKLEGRGGGVNSVYVYLSWDGGTSVTSSKNSGVLPSSDTVKTLGGPADNWGRTWSPSDFSNGNFRLRLEGNIEIGSVSVDAIQVKVYHQASGGGSGGGGDI